MRITGRRTKRKSHMRSIADNARELGDENGARSGLLASIKAEYTGHPRVSNSIGTRTPPRSAKESPARSHLPSRTREIIRVGAVSRAVHFEVPADLAPPADSARGRNPRPPIPTATPTLRSKNGRTSRAPHSAHAANATLAAITGSGFRDRRVRAGLPAAGSFSSAEAAWAGCDTR